MTIQHRKIETVEQYYDEIVNKGAERLDEVRGPGWDKEVSVLTLNIARSDRCVLGQIYGGYGSAPRKFSPTDEHGFLASRERVRLFGFEHLYGSEEAIEEDYRLLTGAWRRLIRQRRWGRATQWMKTWAMSFFGMFRKS